ncbi:NAD(P)/FAD-dependent oxidoreductase [Thermodesulfobacteriota bacterium]
MFDWDTVIIGGGPAGLTAGLYLSRARRRVLLLDRDGFGGYLKNIEIIENYPGFSGGVKGPQLASEMILQAEKEGLRMEQAEVTEIEAFSDTRWVGCENGEGYTTGIIIIAGGSKPRKLGVPGEEPLFNRGVFSCALCDGGYFTDKVVAVCGGGDSAITEALYMSKISSRVLVLIRSETIRASAVLRERVENNDKVDIYRGVKVEAILGEENVEAVEFIERETGNKRKIPLDGVLVQVGMDPNTDYLEGVVPLDEKGQVIVNMMMESEVPGIFAAGDIRSGSPKQVTSAVGDAVIAAVNAEMALQKMG